MIHIKLLPLLQNNYLLACQHVMESVVEAAKPLHPPKVWEDMSCKLYTTFWSLSLYDLYVPVSRYDEEVNKAKQAMQALDDDLVSRMEGGKGERKEQGKREKKWEGQGGRAREEGRKARRKKDGKGVGGRVGGKEK